MPRRWPVPADDRARRQRRRRRPRRGRARRRARRRVRRAARARLRAGGARSSPRPASRSSTRRSRSPRRPTRPAPCARRPEASIVQAVRAVADGRADALVSGGSTGAALAAGLFHVKRAPRRPPARRWPCSSRCRARPFLLLDCGANVEVRPEHLVQFAHMGAAFMEAVMGVARPRVALLSNGTEPTKGTEDVQRRPRGARRRARACAFAGNVEGFAVGTGEADVIVTDGFTGNVFLKVMEGTADALLRAVREAATVEPAGEGRRAAAAARAAAGCATRSTPRRRAARSCSACAGWASCRTARSGRTGSRARSSSRRAACAPTWSAGRTSGWPPRGRCGAARDRPRPAPATVPDP